MPHYRTSTHATYKVFYANCLFFLQYKDKHVSSPKCHGLDACNKLMAEWTWTKRYLQSIFFLILDNDAVGAVFF